MQVTVTIRTLEQQFEGGTVGGDWRIDLAKAEDPGTPISEYEGPNPTTTFDVDAGAIYVVRGVRLDQGGGMLGPVAVMQFEAGSDLVPIDVANTISVVSSPSTARASAPGRRK